MNDREIRRYDMVGRVQTFGKDRPASWPGSSPGKLEKELAKTQLRSLQVPIGILPSCSLGVTPDF